MIQRRSPLYQAQVRTKLGISEAKSSSCSVRTQSLQPVPWSGALERARDWTSLFPASLTWLQSSPGPDRSRKLAANLASSRTFSSQFGAAIVEELMPKVNVWVDAELKLKDNIVKFQSSFVLEKLSSIEDEFLTMEI